MDSLHKAHRLQERAAAVGFDWPSVDGALDKLVEELGEVRAALSRAADDPGHTDEIADELGDLMFSVVNVARLAGAHAAEALERTNREFARRFRHMEAATDREGVRLRDLDLEAMEALWQRAKRARSGYDGA